MYLGLNYKEDDEKYDLDCHVKNSPSVLILFTFANESIYA